MWTTQNNCMLDRKKQNDSYIDIGDVNFSDKLSVLATDLVLIVVNVLYQRSVYLRSLLSSAYPEGATIILSWLRTSVWTFIDLLDRLFQ